MGISNFSLLAQKQLSIFSAAHSDHARCFNQNKQKIILKNFYKVGWLVGCRVYGRLSHKGPRPMGIFIRNEENKR